MSSAYNELKFTHLREGAHYDSSIGKKEPLPHPCNCKTECPYGYGKAFCFPCMAKLMSLQRNAKPLSAKA